MRHRTVSLRPLFATLVAVLMLVAAMPALPAEAHANLVRSEPTANSVFPDSPPAVQIWFSEEPEPRFSEITIYTSAGVPVKTGPLQVAPEDRSSLFVTLNPLSPGTYTVAWKTLSAVDGHTTAGAFAFGVGVGQVVTGPAKGVLTRVGPTSQATPLDVGVRWLSYLAMSILLGALAFPPLVLDPALRALRRDLPGARVHTGNARTDGKDGPLPPDRDKDAAGAVLWVDQVRLAVTRRTLQIISAGFWATVAMTLIAAVVQAANAANVSLLRAAVPAPGSPLLTLLLSTRYGQVWIGRLLLLALLAFVYTRLRASRRLPDRRTQLVWYVAAAVAAMLPITTSLNSHAAALAPGASPGAPVVPILSDWVHLVSTGLWVGGLVQLALALPAGLAVAGAGRRITLLGRVIPKFSVMASACVAALLLTGLYQSLLQVASFGALFGTTYGRALAVKLALVAVLLVLGAFNLLFSGPRLARAARHALHLDEDTANGGKLASAFRLAVRGEALLAAAVLIAAGVMTSSQPAKDAWADITRGVTLEQKADDLDLRLRVNPGEPGFNDFTLTVRNTRTGKPVADAEKVALIVTMVEHDMGENELVLDNQGNGVYEAESGLTSMLGTWNAEALVRRQGRDDVRAKFTFGLGTQPAANAQVGTSGNTGASGTPGAAGTPVAPAEARFLKNPIPADDASFARGMQIYQQNCMVCHGVQGRGDGPAARAMRPPPADLTQHVTAHTEGELWWFVTNGVAGTQMPAWKNSLSDNDRWDVINYITKAFAPGAR